MGYIYTDEDGREHHTDAAAFVRKLFSVPSLEKIHELEAKQLGDALDSLIARGWFEEAE